MDRKTEISSYIKCRIRLNIDSKQIFNKLCGIYGLQTISVCTVFWWVKAFKAGKFSVEDDTRPGRPKASVTLPASVAQLDGPSDWRPGGCGFDPAEVGNILSWRLIMKYFLRSFSSFS